MILFFNEHNHNEQMELRTLSCAALGLYIAKEIIKRGGTVKNPVLAPIFFMGNRELDHYASRVPGPKIVQPFIHLFIYSFIHLFIYSFIHLCIYAFMHLFIYSFIHLLIYSFIHLFIRSHWFKSCSRLWSFQTKLFMIMVIYCFKSVR